MSTDDKAALAAIGAEALSRDYGSVTDPDDHLPDHCRHIAGVVVDALLAAGVRTGDAIARIEEFNQHQSEVAVKWQQRAVLVEAELAEAREREMNLHAIISEQGAVIAAVAALAEDAEMIDLNDGQEPIGPFVDVDSLLAVLTEPADALAAVRAKAHDAALAEVESDIRAFANERFDAHGPRDARGAALWDAAAHIAETLRADRIEGS